jgi:hypothetical protein
MENTVTGLITLVEQDRFTLVDSEGRAASFVLAGLAQVDTGDLRWMQRLEIPVAVSFSASSEPAVATIAHYVRPLTEAQRRERPLVPAMG